MKKNMLLAILVFILLISITPKVYSDEDEGPLIPEIGFGTIIVNVYNESNMSQAIPYDIFISNENGSQTFLREDCSGAISLFIGVLPYGDKTAFVLTSEEYKMRAYYLDIVYNVNYNFSFYLPPYEGRLQGSPPDKSVKSTSNSANVVSYLNNLIIPMNHTAIDITAVYVYNMHSSNAERTKINIQNVTDPTADLLIPMNYSATDIISVFVYNVSSGYGVWELIADTGYHYTPSAPSLTISKDELNENTTKGRVDYYFIYEDPDTSYPAWDLVSDEDYRYYEDGRTWLQM
jgi:hypothetical protein